MCRGVDRGHLGHYRPRGHRPRMRSSDAGHLPHQRRAPAPVAGRGQCARRRRRARKVSQCREEHAHTPQHARFRSRWMFLGLRCSGLLEPLCGVCSAPHGGSGCLTTRPRLTMSRHPFTPLSHPTDVLTSIGPSDMECWLALQTELCGRTAAIIASSPWPTRRVALSDSCPKFSCPKLVRRHMQRCVPTLAAVSWQQENADDRGHINDRRNPHQPHVIPNEAIAL